MKRRNLLKSAAALGLGLGLGQKTFFSASANSQNDELPSSFNTNRSLRGKNIIVVGAGMAGLSAAYFLEKWGADVLLIESSSRVGGRVFTEDFHGVPTDHAADFVFAKQKYMMGTLQNHLHLMKELRDLRTDDLVLFRDLIPHRVGPTDFISWLKNGPFSFLEGLAMAPSLLSNLAIPKEASISDYESFAPFDSGNAKDWADREMGSLVADYIADPLSTFYTLKELKESSPAVVHAMVSMFQGGTKKTPQNGFSQIPQSFAAGISNIQFGKKVASIKETSHGVKVTLENGDQYEADKCILATPADITRKIYLNRSHEEEAITKRGYSTIVRTFFGMKKGWESDYGSKPPFSFVNPNIERKKMKSSVSSVFFGSAKGNYDSLAAEGEVLGVLMCNEFAKKHFEKNEEQIEERLVKDLKKMNSLAFEYNQYEKMKIVKIKNGIVDFSAGWCQKIRDYKRSLAQDPSKKILLAGDYLSLSSTDAAIYTGFWAANRV